MKKTAMLIVAMMLCAACTAQQGNSPYRAAQAQVIARDGHFVAYSDGTVMDEDTGLMWAAQDNGGPITWDEAKIYCRNFRAGGYTDWRMPTLNELTGLYDPKTTNSTPPAEGCKAGCHITNLIRLSCCPVWWWNRIDEVPGFFHFALGPAGWRDQSLAKHHPRVLPVRAGR